MMRQQTFAKKEMEATLDHLMFQLRHMKWKYDLMVEEEINMHYEKNKQSFTTYETILEKMVEKD